MRHCNHVRENELFGHDAPIGKGEKNLCQLYYLNIFLSVAISIFFLFLRLNDQTMQGLPSSFKSKNTVLNARGKFQTVQKNFPSFVRDLHFTNPRSTYKNIQNI